MIVNKSSSFGVRVTAMLLTGTIVAGLASGADAQRGPPGGGGPRGGPPPSAPARNLPAPEPRQAIAVTDPNALTIKSLRVEGSQRIEPDTVLSYTTLRLGNRFTNETLDQAVKDLYASDLFADAQIAGAQTGEIVIRIRENPIINRVIIF